MFHRVRGLLAAAVLLCLAIAWAPAIAAPTWPVVQGANGSVQPSATLPSPRAPLGHVTLSVSSSAASLPSIPAGATVCYLSLEGAAVRFRDDGTAPTASVGTPWTPGPQQLILFTSPLTAEQFIAQSGTATINGDCY